MSTNIAKRPVQNTDLDRAWFRLECHFIRLLRLVEILGDIVLAVPGREG